MQKGDIIESQGKQMNTPTYRQNELAMQPISPELFQSFVEYVEASPRTIETYRKALTQFFRFLYDKGIKAPTRADLMAYKDYLQKEHKPTTVQNYITAVRVFFRWTSLQGIYPNIAEHMKGAKITREHKKDYLNAEQVKTLLSGIDTRTQTGKRNYSILLLMITCGLRTVEISRANVEDLRTIGSQTVLFIQGKGQEEKADFVKVGTETEKALRTYLQERKALKEGTPLFVSESNNSLGQRLTTRSISAIAKQALIKAGFNSSRLTAHSLRHTAVTLALLGGETLEEAQQFARHSNITTTLIYAHNLEKIKNTCGETIETAIF